MTTYQAHDLHFLLDRFEELSEVSQDRRVALADLKPACSRYWTASYFQSVLQLAINAGELTLVPLTSHPGMQTPEREIQRLIDAGRDRYGEQSVLTHICKPEHALQERHQFGYRKANLSAAMVQRIQDAWNDGLSVPAIARELHLTTGVCRKVLHGGTRGVSAVRI